MSGLPESGHWLGDLRVLRFRQEWIATLWLLLCDGKEGPALELAELFRYARGMSCDCEQKIAELRAEVDALRDAFMQTLDETVDKFLETVVRDLGKHLDSVDAKHRVLLARVDERVERLFARLEAATRPQGEERLVECPPDAGRRDTRAATPAARTGAILARLYD